MSSKSDTDDVHKALKSLAISPRASSKSKEDIVDSWEDEDVSDGGPEEPRSPTAGTSAPPPTPINASYNHDTSPGSPASRRGGETLGDRRPEKTDAVARRMIAAGLGLKAPKQTEEQKAYQKAVREKEKKRREEEKAELLKRQEEEKKAKAAIWED